MIARETSLKLRSRSKTSVTSEMRSTIIVLGDARTNGREPHATAFGAISERAGRTFWMNPEPKLYWNYGDSVMSSYEKYCDGVFECWTVKQLEVFVNALSLDRH